MRLTCRNVLHANQTSGMSDTHLWIVANGKNLSIIGDGLLPKVLRVTDVAVDHLVKRVARGVGRELCLDLVGLGDDGAAHGVLHLLDPLVDGVYCYVCRHRPSLYPRGKYLDGGGAGGLRGSGGERARQCVTGAREDAPTVVQKVRQLAQIRGVGRGGCAAWSDEGPLVARKTDADPFPNDQTYLSVQSAPASLAS